MDRSEYNAQLLAKRCCNLTGIDQVLYCGRTGMMSLRLNKNYKADKFLENLKVCIFAESLGNRNFYHISLYTNTR